MSPRGIGLFVAGTDTAVGKTVAAAALVRSLVRAGRRVAVMKPVAAGAEPTASGLRNADALALMAAANVAADYDTVNPCCLAAPVSPHIAAVEAGIAVDFARIGRCFETLASRADCVVVEGAGGWLAPVDESRTMADLARALGLPVVLVVGLRLGCLNHALLTARAVRADGLALAGWIGNRIDLDFAREAENLASLERMLGGAPIAVLPRAREPASLELPAHAAQRLLAALSENT